MQHDILITIQESEPSIRSVIVLRHLISSLAEASDSELKLIPKMPIAGGAFAIVSALLGLATGGLAAGIGVLISSIGAAATYQQAAEWQKSEEFNLKYGIKALAIIDAIGNAELAAIWKAVGSDRFASCLNVLIISLEMGDDGESLYYIDNGVRVEISDGYLLRLSECLGADVYNLQDVITAAGSEPEVDIEPPTLNPIVLKNEVNPKRGGFNKHNSFGLEAAVRTVYDRLLPESDSESTSETSPQTGHPKTPSFNSESNIPKRGVPIETKKGVDIIAQLLNPLKSTIIIGEPGSGKGYLTSHLLVGIKSDRQLPIFGINPKNDEKEDGLWGAADVVFPRDYPVWADTRFGELDYSDQISWIGEAMAAYKKWYRHHDRPPHVLVIDDATTIYGAVKNDRPTYYNLQSLQNNLTTQGDSGQCYLILLGHATNLSVYGGNRDTWAGVRKVYLYSVLKSGSTAIANAGASTFFGKPLSLEEIESAKAIASKSPCGRAVFDGKTGEWIPMEKLPNLSGYDRDTRTFLNPQVQLQSTRLTKTQPSLVSDSEVDQTQELRSLLKPELESKAARSDSASKVDSESIDLKQFENAMRGLKSLRVGSFTVAKCHNTSSQLAKMYGGDRETLENILNKLADTGVLVKSETATGLAKYTLQPRNKRNR